MDKAALTDPRTRVAIIEDLGIGKFDSIQVQRSFVHCEDVLGLVNLGNVLQSSRV